MIPALLTRMSSPPKASVTWATAAWADSSSVTSRVTPMALCPAPVSALAAASAAWVSMSATATAAPASARARQYAVPIPPAPPVTIATLPLRSKLIASPSSALVVVHFLASRLRAGDRSGRDYGVDRQGRIRSGKGRGRDDHAHRRRVVRDRLPQPSEERLGLVRPGQDGPDAKRTSEVRAAVGGHLLEPVKDLADFGPGVAPRRRGGALAPQPEQAPQLARIGLEAAPAATSGDRALVRRVLGAADAELHLHARRAVFVAKGPFTAGQREALRRDHGARGRPRRHGRRHGQVDLVEIARVGEEHRVVDDVVGGRAQLLEPVAELAKPPLELGSDLTARPDPARGARRLGQAALAVRREDRRVQVGPGVDELAELAVRAGLAARVRRLALDQAAGLVGDDGNTGHRGDRALGHVGTDLGRGRDRDRLAQVALARGHLEERVRVDLELNVVLDLDDVSDRGSELGKGLIQGCEDHLSLPLSLGGRRGLV